MHVTGYEMGNVTNDQVQELQVRLVLILKVVLVFLFVFASFMHTHSHCRWHIRYIVQRKNNINSQRAYATRAANIM